MDFTGRVVLVTGSKRIGAAVGKAAAARGADVALGYHRSRAEADEAASAIRATGRRAVCLQADMSDPAACERLVADTVRELGRLDILVNMASRYAPAPMATITADQWHAGRAVDLDAAFHCARAAAPHMREGGRIINFADWLPASGRTRYTDYLPYYVAKGGVIALTEGLALELAPQRVLVNAIAPGPILPPSGATAEEIAAVEEATPLGRWGGADEIVKAVLFLIDSDFITGEVIRVDGGRHLR